MEFSGIRAVVVDIEGTTSSIAFVKESLYPYARKHIPDYVREHADAIQDIIDEVKRIEGSLSLDVPQLIAVLLRWMDDDRKLTPLKTLQGLVWREGFDSGALCAPVYDDALRALTGWRERGLPLYVYSSGSVAAQRLLFSHTEQGDLTSLFSSYFDTTTGSKLEAESYRAIARSVGLPPESILFLTDHTGEIEAARAAGMQAVWVDRGPFSSSKEEPPRIRSFEEIALADSGRHRPHLSQP